MAVITFPDPNIATGSMYAITGESVSKYNERLENAAKYAAQPDTDVSKIVDQELLKNLPYTLIYEETPNTPEMTGNSIHPHQQFINNLAQSFGSQFIQNEAVQNALGVELAPMSAYLQVHELSTTELGGNDAINSYWSFNETDDIIYPNYAIDPDTCKKGLGRVYAETYQKTQVILWLSFGVPKYNKLWDFYQNAVDPKLASALHSGVCSSGFTLGRIIAGGLIFAFRMATLPLYVLTQIGRAFQEYKITKYFELRVTMPLYFRAVNNIAATVAVNMGLLPGKSDVKDPDYNTAQFTGENLPGMMKEGLDIYKIITKRSTYAGMRSGGRATMTSDDLLAVYEKNEGDPKRIRESNPEVSNTAGWFSGFLESIVASGTGSSGYVGFRVEKSTDSSESVSNSTAQSEIQSQLNQRVKQVQAEQFRTMGGDTGTAIGNLVTGAMSGFKEVLTGWASSFGVAGLAGLALGTGYFSIPEVWQDSSFSTSYSFNAQCVAHYCDRVSVYQNYMPLFMLMAAALPRPTGDNTYIQPFLCRGYCQGRFAVTLGIIDSLSIKRGADEFGWTEEGFPTRIDISWTIKDLSPLLFLGLGGGTTEDSSGPLSDVFDSLKRVFEANSSMEEYLSTLGGLGLKERVQGWDTITRKLKVWYNMNIETRLKNPYFWGTTVGSIPAIQTLGAFGWSRLSNR